MHHAEVGLLEVAAFVGHRHVGQLRLLRLRLMSLLGLLSLLSLLGSMGLLGLCLLRLLLGLLLRHRGSRCLSLLLYRRLLLRDRLSTLLLRCNRHRSGRRLSSVCLQWC